jgi:hypothetical protein
MSAFLWMGLLCFSQVPMHAQDTVSSSYDYYRHEFRLTLMQPGLEYIHQFSKHLGAGFSSGWVPIAGSKSYPVLQGEYQVIPHAHYMYGSGVNAIATARYTNRGSTWFIGAGYRFFDSPSDWYMVNVINDLHSTDFLISEQSNSLLLFLGYEGTNSVVHPWSVAYHIRVGESLANYVVKYMDEKYYNYGIPSTTYDPNFPAPPYSNSGKLRMFYMNISISIGKRFGLMPAGY